MRWLLGQRWRGLGVAGEGAVPAMGMVLYLDLISRSLASMTRDSSLRTHVTAHQHTASVVTGGTAPGEAGEGTRRWPGRFTFLEPLPLNPPGRCCCSVTKSCRLLATPRAPGFPVPQHLPDFAQTRVHGRRCHPTISASASFFSFCLSSFPASGSFPVCLFQIKLQNGFLHFLSMCAGQESPEVCAFRDSEQFAVSQPSVCLASGKGATPWRLRPESPPPRLPSSCPEPLAQPGRRSLSPDGAPGGTEPRHSPAFTGHFLTPPPPTPTLSLLGGWGWAGSRAGVRESSPCPPRRKAGDAGLVQWRPLSLPVHSPHPRTSLAWPPSHPPS